MIRLSRLLIIVVWANLSIPSFAQEEGSKHSFESYISNLQSVMIDSLNGNWISDNLIHNRINYFWYPNEHFSFSTQLRTRLVYGESVKYIPSYAASFEKDGGIMDLSVNLLSEKSFLLNTAIDRIYFSYSRGSFVGTLGRQRINWGLNYVWNPNDIFNVQNYFDFDYVEKPGSDAIRLQYYTGAASSLELAAKADHNQNITSAAYYRFNKFGYDFQFLYGLFESQDFVFGTGFSGHISSAGFKGEASYFKPIRNQGDTASVFLAGIGADYMLKNSLYLQVEGLYHYSDKSSGISDFYSWYSGDLNVKKLAFTDVSVFANISYPFTPLLNANLSCMIFPEIKGFFTGPSVNYSVSQNMEFSFISQYFSGKIPDAVTGEKKRQSLFMGFIRFKLSF
ncbi:MAG: hypothetical protein H6538_05545 [Bacteroidales bacterium]|nr:hypothetical protein [Bacteroidales bacterium]